MAFFFRAAQRSSLQQPTILLCSSPVIASWLTDKVSVVAGWPDEHWQSLTESTDTRLAVALLF
jgi:hypothetical protein